MYMPYTDDTNNFAISAIYVRARAVLPDILVLLKQKAKFWDFGQARAHTHTNE
jgi:hypothetical protein